MSEPITLKKDDETVITYAPSQVKLYEENGYKVIPLVESLNEVPELKPSVSLKRTRTKKSANAKN